LALTGCLIRRPASLKRREIEELIMVGNGWRDVWWATPKR
jgi:hypothetical protein